MAAGPEGSGAGARPRASGGERRPVTSAHRQALFAAIFARDGGRCIHCGRPVRPRARGLHRSPDLATLDHLTPRSAGGRTVIENLALACQACNNARGSLSLEAFRAARGRAGEGG